MLYRLFVGALNEAVHNSGRRTPDRKHAGINFLGWWMPKRGPIRFNRWPSKQFCFSLTVDQSKGPAWTVVQAHLSWRSYVLHSVSTEHVQVLVAYLINSANIRNCRLYYRLARRGGSKQVRCLGKYGWIQYHLKCVLLVDWEFEWSDWYINYLIFSPLPCIEWRLGVPQVTGFDEYS